MDTNKHELFPMIICRQIVRDVIDPDGYDRNRGFASFRSSNRIVGVTRDRNIGCSDFV
jgi:hypothetical protein